MEAVEQRGSVGRKVQMAFTPINSGIRRRLKPYALGQTKICSEFQQFLIYIQYKNQLICI